MKILLIITQIVLSLSLYSQIYSSKDSLALLEIDANCDISDSLNWNVEPNPLNWEVVTWDVGTPKRVKKLEIEQKSLSGVLNLTPFDSIVLLNCNYNGIDSLTLNNLNKLADIECSHNNLSYLDISTLNNLKYLFCSHNNLSYVDISALNNLLYLVCSYNNIARINISDTNNYNLQILNCFFNKLTELNFSALPNLKRLDLTGSSFRTLAFPENDSLIFLACAMVGLQSLDISNLTSLEILYCYDNDLTELNIDKQTKLNELECWGNSLTKLDLSATSSLWWLGCASNNISELDISEQYYLAMFDAENNQLKELKLGKHRSLEYFNCSDNLLSEIDLSGAEELLGCVVKNNKLPFSSLATGLKADGLDYSPQNLLYEPITTNGDTILDYSSEAMIESNATEFIFLKNGEVIEKNTTGLFTTSGSGVYHCEMTNPVFPDVVLKTSPIDITRGTEIESKFVHQLSCYPNPATTNVILANYTTKPLIANIYNMNGRAVSSINLAVGNNSINVSDIPKGIYLISTKGNAETIKLIKN
jgi:Leucine-rich repeat (LRR) protein